jgi:hypothetical protein
MNSRFCRFHVSRAQTIGNWSQIPIVLALKNGGNGGQIPINFFPESHALAARHGDSFFWSFAQKMVPRPCGSEVMFQLAEHGGSGA